MRGIINKTTDLTLTYRRYGERRGQMIKRELEKMLRELGVNEPIKTYAVMDDIAFIKTSGGRYELDTNSKKIVKVD